MHSAVPAYSQHLDVKNRAWRHRGCGIVALKMVLDHWHATGRIPRTASLPRLIREGTQKSAYLRNVGWVHRGLAMLAGAHGLTGRNYDWAKETPARAFKKLQREARRGPVLASIHRNLNSKNGGHLVVIIGIRDGAVFYHDPDSKTRRGIARRASIKKFLNGWKRRIIAVHPPKGRRG